MVTIYNTKDATISYSAENDVLLQTINNHLNSNSLREFQTKFIKICQVLNVTKIVSDAEQQKVIQIEDMKWMKQLIIPAMINSGVKYFAIIMPENTIGKTAMRLFAEAVKQIKINVCEDLLSAKEWMSNLTALSDGTQASGSLLIK